MEDHPIVVKPNHQALIDQAVEMVDQALPKSFEFYKEGHVALDPSNTTSLGMPENLEELQCLAYSIQGDLMGVALVLVDRDLDVSMYAEMGNIIVCRMISNIGKDLDVIIGSPKELSESSIRKLCRQSNPVLRKYCHYHDDLVIPVQTVIMAERRKENKDV